MISRPSLQSSLRYSDLQSAIERFLRWLELVGYETYDPYDVWGTSYGKLSRRLYYRKHPLGFAMIAPLILMEVLLPQARALFVRKHRYATADAQLALAFINLYEATKSDGSDTEADQLSGLYLMKARALAADLLCECAKGYAGLGWGYPFDWQHANGLMPKQTPHITATPYCYEVFTKLFDITEEKQYSEVAASIADFVFTELQDTPTAADAAASSYTPHDNSRVVNASAYRAFVLLDAARRWAKPALRAKALKNLRFILQSQREDGAWLYAIEDPAQNFIDHFHTCFVLKNLHKINTYENDSEVEQALLKGYQWYRNNLFDESDYPTPFALAPRFGLVRFEMYDWAESIGLGALLAGVTCDALPLAEKLAYKLTESFQSKDGYWPTRVYRGGMRHTFPYLRWSQAQMFLAFTALLLARRRQSTPGQDVEKSPELLEAR